jgi:chromosome segregation ATPase
MDTRLDILEHEVKEIKAELIAVKANCAWASDCKEIQSRISGIESTLMRMQVDIGRMQGDIEHLQQSVKALEADVKSIHEEIAKIRLEIAGLRAEIAQLRTMIAQLDKRLTNIEETMVTKTELYAALDRFRVELYKHEAKRTQWMIASVVTVVTFQVALTAYLAKLI